MSQRNFKRSFILFVLFLSSFLFVSPVFAADNWHKLSVKDAIQSPLGKEKLTPTVKLFMSGQKHAKAAKEFGSFKSNKRSNAFGKSAQAACDRAFISALISLQERAISEGGNAVVDIYTITKDKKFESAEQYSCIKGGFVANVALMGTVVELN